MMSLLPHVRVIDKQYPPSSELKPLIDKVSDAAFGHWYWEGDVHDDRLSRTPVFRWAPAGWPHRGIYVVARLLWCETNAREPRRLMLDNTCGVYACVNPAHWIDARRPRLWTLPDESDALLVRRSYPTRVPVVHVRAGDSSFAACGIDVSRSHGGFIASVEASRVPITCDDCLKTWLGLQRPLKEIT